MRKNSAKIIALILVLLLGLSLFATIIYAISFAA